MFLFDANQGEWASKSNGSFWKMPVSDIKCSALDWGLHCAEFQNSSV